MRLPAAPRARACTPCAQAEAAGGNSARAHYRRGMALAQLGRPDEAAAAFRAGLASSPGSARLAAALAAAEAAARAGFQQRRAAAGAAAQDKRLASAELQARSRPGPVQVGVCTGGFVGAAHRRAAPPVTRGLPSMERQGLFCTRPSLRLVPGTWREGWVWCFCLVCRRISWVF